MLASLPYPIDVYLNANLASLKGGKALLFSRLVGLLLVKTRDLYCIGRKCYIDPWRDYLSIIIGGITGLLG